MDHLTPHTMRAVPRDDKIDVGNDFQVASQHRTANSLCRQLKLSGEVDSALFSHDSKRAVEAASGANWLETRCIDSIARNHAEKCRKILLNIFPQASIINELDAYLNLFIGLR